MKFGRMSKVNSTVYSPGPEPGTVCAADGSVHRMPAGWGLLPPGDTALTRRVKTTGDHWVIQEKRGRRTFSRGVWAPQSTIERIRRELAEERAQPAYQRRKKADASRRAKAQTDYAHDFCEAVVDFLGFHGRYADKAGQLAQAVTQHATPVGSGTVARTTRIPLSGRTEAAVIAWLRHQTTAYDTMAIPRVKGKRREVRRMLAQRSQQLLTRYRRGDDLPADCPLLVALAGSSHSSPADDE